jgi:PAS domain-containing protein
VLTATTVQALLGDSRLAIMLIRPDGDIVYENAQSRDLWGERQRGANLRERLTIASSWSDAVAKILDGDPVADEPLLLQTPENEAEVAYLTALPQRNQIGDLDSILCVWSARRNALAGISDETPGETLSEYTRNLEAILEHRTYHRMLLAEQDEHARKVLDILPVGILIARTDGTIVYRNQCMTDVFGFRSADLPELNVKYCVSAASLARFLQVVATGLRAVVRDRDPGGAETRIELLPVLNAGVVEELVLQFCRTDVTPAAGKSTS